MAAGATYEPIATTTLSSASSTITFSSIGSAYTDLRLVLVATATVAAPDIFLQFNNDTATNYSYTYLQGNGSVAGSGRLTSQTSITINSSGLTTTTPKLYELDIFSYAGSTNKTILDKSSADTNGGGETFIAVGLWRSTSAITSINLSTSVNSFGIGTTATLYGIKAA